LGVVTAIAIPNFKNMVQNNRIKSTTNNIVSTLQFARQTAAIHKKTVTACTPMPGKTENCAVSNNFSSGIALFDGDIKIEKDTPLKPPSRPTYNRRYGSPKSAGYHGDDYFNSRTSWSFFSDKYTELIVNGLVSNIGNAYSTQRNFYKGSRDYHAKISAFENELIRGISDHKNNIKIMENYIEKYVPIANKVISEWPSGAGISKEATIRRINSHKAMYQSYLERYNEYISNAQQTIELIRQHREEEENEYKLAMEEYNIKTAEAPYKITMKDNKKLLANNPFTVTVTAKLKNNVSAVIYRNDRIKAGQGEIYIEDSRGKGEHSRIICINMLGNLKVVKGNQSCQ